MLKANYNIIKEILLEKRDNLAKYNSIYSFGQKLTNTVRDELLKDINDFLEITKEMLSKGDVYIEMSNSPIVNNSSVEIKTLRLLEETKFKKIMNNGFFENKYFTLVAINAVQIGIVDLNNNDVFKDLDGKMFTVLSRKDKVEINDVVFKPADSTP